MYNEVWEKQCEWFRLGWVICMLKSIIVYPFVFLMWFTQKEVRIHIQWGKVDLVRFFASFLKSNSCLKIRRFVDKRHTCFLPQSQKQKSKKKTWKAQQICISFASFFPTSFCVNIMCGKPTFTQGESTAIPGESTGFSFFYPKRAVIQGSSSSPCIKNTFIFYISLRRITVLIKTITP